MGKFTEGMPERSGGDWFEFKPGQNRLRVVSGGVVLAEHFGMGVCYGKEKGCKGCAAWDQDVARIKLTDKPDEKSKLQPQYKKLFWVIDRVDGKLKLAKLSHMILKALDSLSENEDYSFEDYPMPYDVTITKEGEKLQTKYTVVPSPKMVGLTAEESEAASKNRSAEDIVSAMKRKQMEKDGVAAPAAEAGASAIDYPAEDINPDDIPF